MKKIKYIFLLGFLVMIFGLVNGVNAQVATSTPTPTEANLVASPTITPTADPNATASATPTKITSLPKTGAVQFGAIFAFLSIGMIALGLIF